MTSVDLVFVVDESSNSVVEIMVGEAVTSIAGAGSVGKVKEGISAGASVEVKIGILAISPGPTFSVSVSPSRTLDDSTSGTRSSSSS